MSDIYKRRLWRDSRTYACIKEPEDDIGVALYPSMNENRQIDRLGTVELHRIGWITKRDFQRYEWQERINKIKIGFQLVGVYFGTTRMCLDVDSLQGTRSNPCTTVIHMCEPKLFY